VKGQRDRKNEKKYTETKRHYIERKDRNTERSELRKGRERERERETKIGRKQRKSSRIFPGGSQETGR
jgi:hypothetical protein